jgi:FtsH-binding integral membrane protein
MAAAMLLSGGIAYMTSQSDSLMNTIYNTPLQWVVMLAPLGLVMLLSFRIHKLSQGAAQGLFWLYSALVGVSLAYIFRVYTGVSIANVFLMTSVAFLGLSLWGYTTKKDLSGMGTFLMMGLIGIIVASVVNIFLASSMMQFVISVVGVLLFAGLTAYDTQSIKNEYLQMASMGSEGQAYMGKGAIMGALRLYLDFLNMFMFLLQLFGSRE